MVCSVRHGVLLALLVIFAREAYFTPAPEEEEEGANIAHGRVARDGEFPFQVALLLNYSDQWYQTCGGAILSESVILTAAHCVPKQPLNYLVRAGVNDATSTAGQDRSVQKIVIHPNYEPAIPSINKSPKNDVALLKLSQHLQFNDKVKNININFKKLTPGMECTIIGWGEHEPESQDSKDMLKTGTVMTLTQSDPDVIQLLVVKGDDTVCRGDSGGPLVCNGLVAGVNKEIKIYNHPGDRLCPPDLSQEFASVDYYYDWIKGNMP